MHLRFGRRRACFPRVSGFEMRRSKTAASLLARPFRNPLNRQTGFSTVIMRYGRMPHIAHHFQLYPKRLGAFGEMRAPLDFGR